MELVYVVNDQMTAMSTKWIHEKNKQINGKIVQEATVVAT